MSTPLPENQELNSRESRSESESQKSMTVSGLILNMDRLLRFVVSVSRETEVSVSRETVGSGAQGEWCIDWGLGGVVLREGEGSGAQGEQCIDWELDG